MSNVITKEWMDAHDAAMQGKLQPLADAAVVKTLASAPTGATLTYMIGTESHNFKVGDEARVADNSAETGYVYYKLYDIKNGVAVWDVLGSGDGGGSTPVVQDITVRITLQSVVNDNVTSGVLLNGTTITIKNITDNVDLPAVTWAGNEIICSGLVPSKKYQFTAPAINGFTTPAAFTTPILTEGMTLTHVFQYMADGYSVVIDSDQTDKSAIAGARVIHNNLEYANGGTIIVPTGTSLIANQNITATDLSGSDYRLTLSISGTTITAMYTLIIRYVDMGNGVLWAQCNLTKNTDGTYKLADNPWEPGAFFSWGDIEGHNVEGQNEGYRFNEDNYNSGLSGNGHNLTAGFSSGDATYDAATAKLGSPWRMPTKAEFEWLTNTNNCTHMSVTSYQGHSAKGMVFTSKINGNTLFFPISNQNYSGNSTQYGIWWSTDSNPEQEDTKLGLESYAFCISDYGSCYVDVPVRPMGNNIRPVQ